MTQLFECSINQAKRFNEVARTAKRLPKAKGQEEWAAKVQQNYPFDQLRKGESGSVTVRLTINDKGRATFCQVLRYNGPAGFNDSACVQMLRHSRFEPMIDAKGAAVAGFYSTTITYRITK